MDKIKVVIKQNKILLVVVLGILFIALGLGLYSLNANKDIAARVGKEVITREEFNKRLPKEQKAVEVANADSQDNLNKNLETLKKDTINKMIEERVLNEKVKELGITVSDDEIKTEVDKLVKVYKDRDEYEATISSTYGWNNSDVETSTKYRLLKEKISSKFVSTRDIQSIYVRWDMTGQENKPEATAESVASQADKKIKEYEEKIKTLGFLPVVDLVKKERSESKIILGSVESKGINKNIFLPDEEKNAIWSLKEGEISQPIKSSGGYYTIIKVVKISSGSFNSYDDFLNEAKKTLGVKVYLPEASPNNGFWWILRARIIGVANADCGSCGSSVGSQWYGLVYDSITNVPIGGASVSVANTGAGVSCGSNGAGYSGWCGPKSGSTNSSAAGYFQFGRNDGWDSFVNCGWTGSWRLTSSKTGYQDYSTTYSEGASGLYGTSFTNGNNFNINIPMVSTSRTVETNYRPEPYYQNPYDGREFTRTTAATIASSGDDCYASFTPSVDGVKVCMNAYDVENDAMSYSVRYRTAGAATWWDAIAPNGNAETTRDKRNYVKVIFRMPNAKATGSYEWTIKAKDATHTSPNSKTPYRTFSIVDPVTLTATLSASPSAVLTGQTSNLTTAVGGTATGAITYSGQSCGSGGTASNVSSSSGSFTCTYSTAGSKTASITVSRGGLTVTPTAVITVTPPPSLSCGTLRADPEGGTLPLTVLLTAENFTASNFTTTPNIVYTWDFDDGSPLATTTNQNTINHTYTKSGPIVAAVTVNETTTGLACIRTTKSFNVNPWSDGDQNEVAP